MTRRATAIVRVRVGRTVVALTAPQGHPAAQLVRAEKTFACPRGGDLLLELSLGPLPEPPAGPPAFDSGGLWRVWHRPGGGLLYAFRAPDSDEVIRTLEVDRRFERGVLSMAPSRWSRRRGFAWFHPALELALHHRLARRGGLIVHASAVRCGRQTLLFTGVSGAGKTTLARLFARHAPRVEVLADDRVCVERGPSHFEAAGTPWAGEGGFASPASGRLAGVAFLEQATENAVDRLSPREAGVRLYSLSFAPPFDPQGIRGALATCDSLVKQVPAYRLRFRKDSGAVELALALLRRR